MPHERSRGLRLGHTPISTGPSPVLVALGALLLGGWAYVALGVGALAPVTLACLVARPVPATLAPFPLDTAPVPSP